MQDLTEYGDTELSMYFQNDEYLYNVFMKGNNFEEVQDVADEFFIYASDQLDDLHADWEIEHEA